MKRDTGHILYLKSLKCDSQGKHDKTFLENTTTVVINKMGKCKNHALNKRAHEIWDFCQQFHIWVRASPKPGKENL